MAKRRIPFGLGVSEWCVFGLCVVVGAVFVFIPSPASQTSTMLLGGAIGVPLAAAAIFGYRLAVWIYRNRQSVCYTLSDTGELVKLEGQRVVEAKTNPTKNVIEVFAGRKSVLHGPAADDKWRIVGDDGNEDPWLFLVLMDPKGNRVSTTLSGALRLVRFSHVAGALEAGRRAAEELKEKDVALEYLHSLYEALLRRAAWAIMGLTFIIGRISSGVITSPSAARKEIEFILDHAPDADLAGETPSREIEEARVGLQQLFAERDAERQRKKANAARPQAS